MATPPGPSHSGAKIKAGTVDIAALKTAQVDSTGAGKVAKFDGSNRLQVASASADADVPNLLQMTNAIEARAVLAALGISDKGTVRAMADANVASLSGPQTIDGVSLIADDDVLLTGQSTGSQNGAYTVKAGAWIRTANANTSAGMKPNSLWRVSEGTTYHDQQWWLTTDNPITLGTTALVITQFAGAAGTTPVAGGGTGITSYTTGDMLYASGGGTLAKLLGVATGNALISGGVGVAPSWGKIALTTHVSGTLPVGNGGTGMTSYTTGDIVAATGASALGVITAGASGTVLTGNGAGVAPTFQAPAATGGVTVAVGSDTTTSYTYNTPQSISIPIGSGKTAAQFMLLDNTSNGIQGMATGTASNAKTMTKNTGTSLMILYKNTPLSPVILTSADSSGFWLVSAVITGTNLVLTFNCDNGGSGHVITVYWTVFAW